MFDQFCTVQTLRTIFRKLQNQTVNIERTSCSDQNWNFVVESASNSPTSNITCDCTFNASSVCRVTNIQLKSFSLPGIFPPEFGNLTRLREMYAFSFLSFCQWIIAKMSEAWNLSNLCFCFLTEIFRGTFSMEQYLRHCLKFHLKSCNHSLQHILVSCDD